MLLSTTYCAGEDTQVKGVQFTVAAHIMAALAYYHGEEVSSAILANRVNADRTFVRKSLRKSPVRREMESRCYRHDGTAIHNGNKSLQVNGVHEFLSPRYGSF